ncbi:MAG TPA: hypothetical protein VF683_02650, partial [Chthoniobacterales bacterium]
VTTASGNTGIQLGVVVAGIGDLPGLERVLHTPAGVTDPGYNNASAAIELAPRSRHPPATSGIGGRVTAT